MTIWLRRFGSEFTGASMRIQPVCVESFWQEALRRLEDVDVDRRDSYLFSLLRPLQPTVFNEVTSSWQLDSHDGDIDTNPDEVGLIRFLLVYSRTLIQYLNHDSAISSWRLRS